MPRPTTRSYVTCNARTAEEDIQPSSICASEVGPPLEHFPVLSQVLGVVVDAADTLLLVGKCIPDAEARESRRTLVNQASSDSSR
jgi:hypothetical protein